MLETATKQVHPEHAVLDIGGDIGALIIHSRHELCGHQLDVSPKGPEEIHADQEGYERVTSEIKRGLELINGAFLLLLLPAQ